MKKWLMLICLFAAGCAQDPYRLKIDNSLNEAHGQSIYFRSSLRSTLAAKIRNVLSNKFTQMGIKTATVAEAADYIAIFDIETLYHQDKPFKNTTLSNISQHDVLFTDDEDAESLYYSGNANMVVDHDQTCFTLNIGPKGTSDVKYTSSFCSNTVEDTEEFVPHILDIYGKYATYLTANVGIQCIKDVEGNISCNPITDRQQEFINSLWREHDITDDETTTSTDAF